MTVLAICGIVLSVVLWKLVHRSEHTEDTPSTPYVPPQAPQDDGEFRYDGYDKDEFPNAYYDDTWDMDDDGHT